MTLLDEFSQLLATNDKEACVRWAIAKMDSREIDSIVTLHATVLAPSLNVIACTEENKARCIYDEHIKTAIVRTIVELAYPHVVKERGSKNKGRKVIILCPPEEYHDVGARMAADYFTIAGFDVIFVGANTPKNALAAAVADLAPEYVAISVSNPYHAFAVQKLIEELRRAGQGATKIVVGGSALAKVPDMYKTLGADMYLTSFHDIEQLP